MPADSSAWDEVHSSVEACQDLLAACLDAWGPQSDKVCQPCLSSQTADSDTPPYTVSHCKVFALALVLPGFTNNQETADFKGFGGPGGWPGAVAGEVAAEAAVQTCLQQGIAHQHLFSCMLVISVVLGATFGSYSDRSCLCAPGLNTCCCFAATLPGAWRETQTAARCIKSMGGQRVAGLKEVCKAVACHALLHAARRSG